MAVAVDEAIVLVGVVESSVDVVEVVEMNVAAAVLLAVAEVEVPT